MLFDGLSPVEEEGRYGHADNQHKGCHPGEKSQHQEQGAEDLCEDDQYQGPAVADMKGVEKDVLLATEMHHFGESVIYADQQTKGEAQE